MFFCRFLYVHTSHLNSYANIRIFFGCTIFLIYFFPFNHAFLSHYWTKTYEQDGFKDIPNEPGYALPCSDSRLRYSEGDMPITFVKVREK